MPAVGPAVVHSSSVVGTESVVVVVAAVNAASIVGIVLVALGSLVECLERMMAQFEKASDRLVNMRYLVNFGSRHYY